MNLTQRIKEKALALGFDLIGIAPASRAPHAEAFRRWLDNGYHAGMAWLERQPERREEPALVVPGAQSVVVVGLSYFTATPPAELWHNPAHGRIARYAWGLDYHDILLPKVRDLGRFIEQEAARSLTQRAYVDTGPVLERGFAAQAGLGFIGKNTLLISPRWGSYLFLAEILVDVSLDYDTPAADAGASLPLDAAGPGQRTASCGRCTRCLTICPTHAFPAPYILDSNRCISYLTIEHKGAIPPELRPLLKNWIYGCDECQEVCPWVNRYIAPARPEFLRYQPEWAAPKLIDLMAMDEAAFQNRFRGTPVKRTKRRGLLRNVAIALGNWGSSEALPVLERALSDPEPLIREHAAWAIAAIA